MKKRIRNYFGSAPFYRMALTIALPVMLQTLIQSLVSLVDNFMVSGLGDVKMSGVNVAGHFTFIFMTLINTVCSAGGIFLTQYSGAKDRHGMQKSVGFKVILGFVSLILYLVVFMGLPGQMMKLMLTDNTQAEAIIKEGVPYMVILGFAGVPMIVSTVIASSFRDVGEVKAPLVISAVATLTNTLFNFILIYGNLGAPKMEVRGAALATLIARGLEMVLYVWLIVRKKPDFMGNVREILGVDGKLFVRILKKGSLVLFSNMLWVAAETVSTAIYNGRGGADVVSGMSASFTIANLFFVAFGGITTAAAVMLGKCLGSGALEEAKRQKRWLLSGAVVLGVAMCAVGACTMPLVDVCFGNLSAASRDICKQMVFCMAMFMPLWVFNNTQFAVAKAGGDTLMGAVIDGTTIILIAFPAIFLMDRFTAWGPVTMYVVIKLIDVIKAGMAYVWLKKETWVKNLAEGAA